jgi:hypothetical protein
VTHLWRTCDACGKRIFWAWGGEFWLHDIKAGETSPEHMPPNARPEQHIIDAYFAT